VIDFHVHLHFKKYLKEHFAVPRYQKYKYNLQYSVVVIAVLNVHGVA